MSDKRNSSVVKDKGSTPDKTAKKDDKVDKKESQALLNTKSPRDDTAHKRASSYRESPDKGAKPTDAKNDKDAKDKGGKPVDPKARAKMRYEDVMLPDDPLTMVKELLLEQAAQTATDEELHEAELKYKKNPTSDQSKFDYSVTMVRTRKTAIIDNGISNLKVIYGSMKRNAEIGNMSDLNIARGCLYYIAFAYFRTMKFAYAIQYANASVQENPNNIQAQALDIVRFPKAFEDVVLYKKATKDEAALLAPRKSFQGSGVKTTGVDKKNKEIADLKKTQAKEDEALKKKEDKEKEKEREREEKEKEREAKKQEEKRKEEESKRTRLEKKRVKRDAKGGPTWVDELADELESDSESATPSEDKPVALPGMALKVPVPMPSNMLERKDPKKEKEKEKEENNSKKEKEKSSEDKEPEDAFSPRTKDERKKRESTAKLDSEKAKKEKEKDDKDNKNPKEKEENKNPKEKIEKKDKEGDKDKLGVKDDKKDARKSKKDPIKKEKSIDSSLPIPVPPPNPKTDDKGVVILDEKEKQLLAREARIAELEKKLKEAEEAKDSNVETGGLSLDDIIAGGDDMLSLSAAIGDDFQLSDNPMDDLDFVKRNIAELSGKLSSIYGIDVDNFGNPKNSGYVTDESGMLVRNLVDMNDMTSAVDEAILGGGATHSNSMQSVLNDILPDLPIQALGRDHDSNSIYGMASMAASQIPATKERPWVVLRRFNKRGGKKILASDKFGVEISAVREAETEAEVEDINGVKADSVLLVLTADEEAEFD